MVTDLIEEIDAGNHALLSLFDLSAAFDTVDHDVLVERLERTYGIRSVALDWLRSYLSSRRQTVLYDGVLSSVRSLVCGVPQGCCSCSTRPTSVILPPVSACHLISTPMTRSSTRGADRQLMNSSGEGWSWALSGSRSGCDLTDSVSTPRRRISYGVRPADGALILTLAK